MSNSKSSGNILIDCSLERVNQPWNNLKPLPRLLPKSIEFDEIKGLKLTGHPIKSLEGVPKSLVILNIANCYVTSLPMLDKVCPQLTLLNVSKNNLANIPSIPSLNELYASNNSLNDIPSCSSLIILEISQNPITNIMIICVGGVCLVGCVVCVWRCVYVFVYSCACLCI